jgi:hypothetical protein
MRPRRAKGSWIPRLAGIGMAAALAGGGLAFYLNTQHPAQGAPRHPPASLSSRVIKAQAVGIIDFGPDDDKDAFGKDPDDHPLMLKPTSAGMEFVTISAAQLTGGMPTWTANQMGDGNEIFIYTPTGRCLAAAPLSRQLILAHCDLMRNQRWRPVHAEVVLGQAIAAYANDATGSCLTAPPPNPERGPPNPGAAILAPCGVARDRTQEIAFWWSP